MKIRNFLLAATLIFGGTFAVSSCSDDDDDRAKPEFIGPDFAVSKTEVALAGAKPSSITVKAPVRPHRHLRRRMATCRRNHLVAQRQYI